MAVTPPAPSRLRTPPAPVHGPKYDSYEPYKAKKPARVQRQRDTLTPPPSSIKPKDLASPKRNSARIASTLASPPPSAYSTPHQSSVRKNGHLKRPRNAPVASGLDSEDEAKQYMPNRRKAAMMTEMLPTPAKTPNKRLEVDAADVEEAACVLFPSRPETVEEVMPSPKRRKMKKSLGFSLDSFEELSKTADKGDEIPIFTDWKEREPEDIPIVKQGFVRGVQKLPDPFSDAGDDLLKAEKAELSKQRKRKVKMALMPDGSEKPVSELVGREDGLLKDFRGKTFFQPFAEGQRSSYQPVSLWPGKLRSQRVRHRALSESDDGKVSAEEAEVDPEEQTTDIESSEDVSDNKHTKTSAARRSSSSPFSSWPRAKPGSVKARPRSKAH